MAPQYIYIFSNPSMPGLIKVGKTTTSPAQRLAELHTTGVPTPFEIECAFVVDDCSGREKIAHQALSAYRVKGREFFKVSVQEALHKILPFLGDYTIHHAKSEYGVKELTLKLQEQRDERLRQEEIHRQQDEQRKNEQRRQELSWQEQRRKRNVIEQRLTAEQDEIYKWYQSEYDRLFPHHSPWLYRIVAGVAAIFVLIGLESGMTDTGLVICVGLCAWFGGAFIEYWMERMCATSSARVALDEELAARLKALREIIRPCANCGQSLRFNRVDVLLDERDLNWSCPKCGGEILPSKSSDGHRHLL